MTVIPGEAREPTSPGTEDDPEVLRQMGWRIEGERTCDTCGLAPMDLERYRVCSECHQCLECGHEEECPESLSSPSETR